MWVVSTGRLASSYNSVATYVQEYQFAPRFGKDMAVVVINRAF